jgi:hypothetical protein
VKVYPQRWQGARRPVVATYENGQRVLWLIFVEQGRVRASCGGKNGRWHHDALEVARQARALYGDERLEAAFGRSITEED